MSGQADGGNGGGGGGGAGGVIVLITTTATGSIGDTGDYLVTPGEGGAANTSGQGSSGAGEDGTGGKLIHIRV